MIKNLNFCDYYQNAEAYPDRRTIIINYDPAFINEFKGKKRIRKKKMNRYIASIFNLAIKDIRSGKIEVDVSD